MCFFMLLMVVRDSVASMILQESSISRCRSISSCVLRQEHAGQTLDMKRLGRLLQICLVCSTVLEAFGTTPTVSGQIQLAKS